MRPVALVTGSSRGIGLAAAEALAREGVAVALNGPADDAELAVAAERVAALGVPVFRAAFDVTDLPGHDARLAEIEPTTRASQVHPKTVHVSHQARCCARIGRHAGHPDGSRRGDIARTPTVLTAARPCRAPGLDAPCSPGTG